MAAVKGVVSRALAVLAVSVLLVAAGSCISGEDKKAVQDIAVSNSVARELTSNRSYKTKWVAGLAEENGVLIAGLVDITFASPVQVDRDWPSLKRTVSALEKQREPWVVNQTGAKTYEMRDYQEGKLYSYDFTGTTHSAKLAERLRVYVYFVDENCLVIEPLAAGEGQLEK